MNNALNGGVARHFCRDERNPQRISKRLRLEVDKLNWKGIEFPMKLNKNK